MRLPLCNGRESERKREKERKRERSKPRFEVYQRATAICMDAICLPSAPRERTQLRRYNEDSSPFRYRSHWVVAAIAFVVAGYVSEPAILDGSIVSRLLDYPMILSRASSRLH